MERGEYECTRACLEDCGHAIEKSHRTALTCMTCTRSSPSAGTGAFESPWLVAAAGSLAVAASTGLSCLLASHAKLNWEAGPSKHDQTRCPFFSFFCWAALGLRLG